MGRTRNLRWEAGAAVAKGLDFYDGLKSITRNIAEMFQITNTGTGSIRLGTKANIVGFSANPLSFDGTVQFVAVGNEVDCTPANF